MSKTPNPKAARTAKRHGNDDYFQYLLECHEHSREMITFRLSQRAEILKTYLITQGALLALAFGLSGFTSTAPSSEQVALMSPQFPLALVLTGPVALIFTLLYSIEDWTVDAASRNIAELSEIMAQEYGTNEFHFHNFDASLIAQFTKVTVPMRFAAQFLVFVLCPGIITLMRNLLGYGIPYSVLFNVVDLISLVSAMLVLFNVLAWRRRPFTGIRGRRHLTRSN